MLEKRGALRGGNGETYTAHLLVAIFAVGPRLVIAGRLFELPKSMLKIGRWKYRLSDAL
jgi:hypothetical protein